MPFENLTIFAGRTDPDVAQANVRRLAPDAAIQSGGAGWQAVITLGNVFKRRRLIVTCDPNYYSEPNWSRQKDGLRGYIGRFANIHRVPKAFEFVNGLGFALATVFDPPGEVGDPRYAIVLKLAAAVDGAIFAGDRFLDAEGRVLFSASGEADSQAAWPGCCVASAPVAPNPARLAEILAGFSAETRARLERSVAILDAQGVGVFRGLAMGIDAAQMKQLSTEDIVYRMLAVDSVAMHAELAGAQPAVRHMIEEKGIANALTAHEAGFLADPEPDPEARAHFAWRYEAVWVFLWALGYVDRLDPPVNTCDVRAMAAMVRDPSAAELIRNAKPRSAAELLDQADLALRYHWAAVEARLRGGTLPPQFDPGVIYERHYALNWLIDPAATDWDDVDVST